MLQKLFENRSGMLSVTVTICSVDELAQWLASLHFFDYEGVEIRAYAERVCVGAEHAPQPILDLSGHLLTNLQACINEVLAIRENVRTIVVATVTRCHVCHLGYLFSDVFLPAVPPDFSV